MYSYRVEEVEYDAAQIADAHSVDDPCQYSAADRQLPPGCTLESARSLLSLESWSMCAPVQYPPRSAIRSYATLPNIVALKPCSSHRAVRKRKRSRHVQSKRGLRRDLLGRWYPGNGAAHDIASDLSFRVQQFAGSVPYFPAASVFPASERPRRKVITLRDAF
jgi:hypothetical protein